MAECEVCGEDGAVVIALIEGAKLHVCADCAKRGRILTKVAPTPTRPLKPAARQAAPEREIEFVADYAERIRSAREKMRIGVDVLAELVMETESFLKRIEAGKAQPTEELARKLEKELGIKLFEEVTYTTPAASKEKPGGLTLGDMIVVKKKGQKGEK